MKKSIAAYSEFDPSVITNRYQPFLLELYALIQKRFSNGASNRWDNAECMDIPTRHKKLNELSEFDVLTSGLIQRKENGSQLIQFMHNITHGNCEMLCSYAQGTMLSRYPDVTAEVVYLDEHCMLILGRAKDSDPQNIETWGNEALIIDFWAELAYRSQNFHSVRAQANDVPYCLKAINPETGAIIRTLKSTQHYLTGTPHVYVCEKSVLYDHLFKQWVAHEHTHREGLVMKSPSSTGLFAHQPPPAKLLAKYRLENGDASNLEKGLRRAAALKNTSDMRLFLTHVQNVNAQDQNPTSRKTALHWSAEKNDKEGYDLLVASGAKDDIPDALSRTPSQILVAHAGGYYQK